MKTMRLIFLSFVMLLSVSAFAQEDTTAATADSTVAAATTMTEENESMVAGMTESDYYAAADERFNARQERAAAEEAGRESYEDSRMMAIIILLVVVLVVGAIKAGGALAAHKNMLATMKPEIYHVWPSTTKDKTGMDVMIPEAVFSANLEFIDSKYEVAKTMSIDNATTHVEVDVSDLPEGKYQVRLNGGPEHISESASLVRV